MVMHFANFVLWGHEKYPDFAIGPQNMKLNFTMGHELF